MNEHQCGTCANLGKITISLRLVFLICKMDNQFHRVMRGLNKMFVRVYWLEVGTQLS